MRENILDRQYAASIIQKYKDKNVIKILTGIRRSGKSFVMRQLRDLLVKESDDLDQVIYIDFEEFDNSRFLNTSVLYEYVKDRAEKIGNKRLYLLFDEIQEAEGWEKLINSLYASEKMDCDIYITGSNAKLLSSELATYLSGRYVTIEIFPLSYNEYLQFTSLENSANSFLLYMKHGGFPGAVNFKTDEESLRSYIQGIYATVLLKDVISRNKIRDTALLEKIILYITENIGNIFSAKRISDFMKSTGRSLAVETVYNDVEALQNALYLYKVSRYDLRGKKILETMEKYYIADTGLRFCLMSFSDTAINGLLENIVFIELLRRGYKVSIGKLGEYEIDFVAEKSGTREYIQVAYLLSSPEVIEREYRPLRLINDNYKKQILTLDELPEADDDGIVRRNIRDWLVEMYMSDKV